ncbi:MAG: WD40 repeat domain-containing protein, partial [Thermomicrobiales bacterium]
SKYVVAGGFDATAIVWAVATGQPVAVLAGHTDRVTGVAYSHDGKMIATASFDNTVKLWPAP